MRSKTEFSKYRDLRVEEESKLQICRFLNSMYFGGRLSLTQVRKQLGENCINEFSGEVYSYRFDWQTVAQVHVHVPKNGWEHISISLYATQRTPSYEEMVTLKNLFWKPSETCIEVHPKKSEYINVHPYCLHIWKKADENYEEANIVKELISVFPENTSASIHVDQIEISNKTYLIVAGPNRWPTWDEMCQIKQQYFDPEEPVVQYHLDKETDLNDKFIIVIAPAPKELPSIDMV